MISKEENILFPMSLQTLTQNEWAEIWSASPQYGWCLVEPQKGYHPPAAAAAATSQRAERRDDHDAHRPRERRTTDSRPFDLAARSRPSWTLMIGLPFSAKARIVFSRAARRLLDVRFNTATRRAAPIRSTRSWTTFAQAVRALPSSGSTFKTSSFTSATSRCVTTKENTWARSNSPRT